jgi:hypothetical protein
VNRAPGSTGRTSSASGIARSASDARPGRSTSSGGPRCVSLFPLTMRGGGELLSLFADFKALVSQRTGLATIKAGVRKTKNCKITEKISMTNLVRLLTLTPFFNAFILWNNKAVVHYCDL